MSAIERLDPRRDMSLIRERIERLLETGADPQPSMTDLAQRDPLALADLVVGPKAIRDPAWLGASLEHAETLEASLAPNGLYRRLVSLVPDLHEAVLGVAAGRHPGASWLVELSRKTEGSRAGTIHLLATAGHPSFAQNCWAHAAAGHLPGLIAVAGKTGRPEPAAALTAEGHVDAAAHAMVAALERAPDSPVVAMMAAAWGPDPVPVLRRALPHLRSRKVAVSLRHHCKGYPGFASLLDTIIQAMVHA